MFQLSSSLTLRTLSFAVAATTLALSCLISPSLAEESSEMRELFCRRQPTMAARAICLSNDLIQRDAYMNEVSGKLRKLMTRDAFKSFQREQVIWVKERNGCGADAKCITSKYEDRTAVIEQIIENLENPDKSHTETGCRENEKFIEGKCVSQKKSSSTKNENHEDNMVWATHRIPNYETGKIRSIVLSYGIPETDAVLFEGSCETEINNTSANVLMNYNISHLSDGQLVKLNIKTDNYNEKHNAAVYGHGRTEEGVVGVLIKPTFEDNFWSALSSGTLLTYGLNDQPDASIALKNSEPAIKRFVQDCKKLAAGTMAASSNNKEPAGK